MSIRIDLYGSRNIITEENKITLLYLELIQRFPPLPSKFNEFLKQKEKEEILKKLKKVGKRLEEITVKDLKSIVGEKLELLVSFDGLTILGPNLTIFINEEQFLLRYFFEPPKDNILRNIVLTRMLHPFQAEMFSSFMNDRNFSVRNDELKELWKNVLIMLSVGDAQTGLLFPFNEKWYVNAVFELTNFKKQINELFGIRIDNNKISLTEIGYQIDNKFKDQIKISKLGNIEPTVFQNMLPKEKTFRYNYQVIFSSLISPIDMDFEVNEIKKFIEKRFEKIIQLGEDN